MDFKYYNEGARKRYILLRSHNMHQERGFALDILLGRPEIKQQLVVRKWETYNEILIQRDGDKHSVTLVKEFIANASQKLPGGNEFTSYVRGKLVDYSPSAINKLLGCDVPRRCAFRAMKEEFDDWDEPTRRVVKDFVALPGTEWLHGAGGDQPSKIPSTHFKPIARVWLEFFLRNIMMVSNTTEAQVDVAAGVKLIMEGEAINLGQLICASIYGLVHNTKSNFKIGHCNLINALCLAQDVPTPPLDDEFLIPMGGMRIKDLQRFSVLPKGYVPPNEGEEAAANVNQNDDNGDEDQHGIDEVMQQIDEFPEQPQVPVDQQAPHVPPSSHSVGELATLPHLMDLSQEAGLQWCYLDTQSSLYMEAMGVRDATPPNSLFAHLYPDQASWDTHLQEDHSFFLARQERQTSLWRAEIGACDRAMQAREEEARRREEMMKRMEDSPNVFDMDGFEGFDFMGTGPAGGV
ncbi:hypothetical protein A2U01_0000699 [Trifolium medium]|uniref:Putative plant transposon protein domain-containing protein n=1 Tax=Trifolium medium TaxID=97028 RepID=A0A392LYA3_9FABA|nr:hypothetical protein [Trifolium medium]